MIKTLIGIVTFGNLPFTRLCVQGIRETTTKPYDLFMVVGKPGDKETEEWLKSERIPHIVHNINMGFPASINDIYDWAWVSHYYDAVIIAGNDIVPYPGAIDALIETAETTPYEWVCSSQFDSHSLVARYPETKKYFEGERMVFTDFDARPWEIHKDFRNPSIEPDTLKDVRNLTLFKRSVFSTLGYADVNFWSGGYFEDNDYARRALNAGIKACGVPHSAYFHFWSRTIHQGSGGSTNKLFENNRMYYQIKWGGAWDDEKYTRPFDGAPFKLDDGIILPGSLKIGNRMDEEKIQRYWRQKVQ